jgi:hypothetical protein
MQVQPPVIGLNAATRPAAIVSCAAVSGVAGRGGSAGEQAHDHLRLLPSLVLELLRDKSVAAPELLSSNSNSSRSREADNSAPESVSPGVLAKASVHGCAKLRFGRDV